MARVWIVVACLVTVACCLEDSQCPFTLENKITLNGFRDKDIIRCEIQVFACANGSFSLRHNQCYVDGAFRALDAVPIHYSEVHVGWISTSFTKNLTTFLGLLKGPDEFYNDDYGEGPEVQPFSISVYANMEQVHIHKMGRGSFNDEELKTMLDEIKAAIPKMFNHDPLYQMQLYRDANPTTMEDYLSYIPETMYMSRVAVQLPH